MDRPGDDDEGRIHTPEEIALAYAEVDQEIRQRMEAREETRDARRKREREIYG